MSDGIPHVDVIGASSLELPPGQLQTKLEAEQLALLEVEPFELEKLAVTQDHIQMQSKLWGDPEPLATPANFTESSRKA